MRNHWVVLGMSIFVPSILLTFYLKDYTWTEVVGYTTYVHHFHPVLWIGASILSGIGLLVLMSGMVLEPDFRRARVHAQSICPHCGSRVSTRFCQNCGARIQ